MYRAGVHRICASNGLGPLRQAIHRRSRRCSSPRSTSRSRRRSPTLPVTEHAIDATRRRGRRGLRRGFGGRLRRGLGGGLRWGGRRRGRGRDRGGDRRRHGCPPRCRRGRGNGRRRRLASREMGSGSRTAGWTLSTVAARATRRAPPRPATVRAGRRGGGAACGEMDARRVMRHEDRPEDHHDEHGCRHDAHERSEPVRPASGDRGASTGPVAEAAAAAAALINVARSVATGAGAAAGRAALEVTARVGVIRTRWVAIVEPAGNTVEGPGARVTGGSAGGGVLSPSVTRPEAVDRSPSGAPTSRRSRRRVEAAPRDRTRCAGGSGRR